jgi:hypothetical protein
MNTDHYTYRVTWSAEDGEHLGPCAEFPPLSWLAAEPEDALSGIRAVVVECVRDMQAGGEAHNLTSSLSGRAIIRNVGTRLASQRVLNEQGWPATS